MRLNPDCIRDILLFIESTTDSNIRYVNFETILNALSQYDEDTIHYHILQIKNSELILELHFSGRNPFLIGDLSPKGHEFLENIRSDSNWNKTKEIAGNIGSFSINNLSQIAIGVVTQLITQNFS